MIEAEALDLAQVIRPGDCVVVGQGTAEPRSLTEALVAQHAGIGPLRLFLGAVFSDSFPPEACGGLAIAAYGGIGGAGRLARAGLLDPLPAQYSRLPDLFETGLLPADVVLLQLAPGRDGAPFSLGLSNDHLPAAAKRARLVIAEVNERVPWTHGGELPAEIVPDLLVRSARPPVELPPSRIGPVEERIAALVAPLIPDGATIETGIGAIPDAILAALGQHRDLGVHSGMIGDRLVDLVEAGVVTNARKPLEPGVTVAGSLFGTARLFAFADRNPLLRLRPPAVTHNVAVLAGLPRFTAINSAIEVDLSGQVNGEVAGAAYVGAVGGQVDFVRGANAAPGGRSIIALPATAKGGRVSRIVASLEGRPVTSLRSDADLVVTEWGVAELRGQGLAERARRMIAIADPAFREALARAAHPLTQGLG